MKWIALPVAVAFLAATFLKTDLPHSLCAPLDPVAIPRKRWMVDAPFSNWLASRKTPVILTNTIAAKWRVHSAFETSKGVASRLRNGSLENVYHHPGNNVVFGPFFDPSRPFATFPSVRPRNEYIWNATVSAKDFQHAFDRESPGVVGTYHYVGAVEEALVDGAVEDLFEPMDEFFLLNPKQASLNIWIGQRGAVTPCHYDGYYNLYLQIKGSKRFVLLPPNARVGQQPTFPFLHPSFGQCHKRIPFDKSVEQMPCSASVEPMWIGEVNAGDLLYIPPEWLHEVTAVGGQLGSSVAVNVWTSHADAEVMEQIFALPLPQPMDGEANFLREEDQDRYDRRVSQSQQRLLSRRRAVMGAMVVSRVLRRHFSGVGRLKMEDDTVLSTARRFFNRLMLRRYAPLMESEELPGGFFAGMKEDDDIFDRDVSSALPETRWPWVVGGGICEGKFPQRRFTQDILPGGKSLDDLEEYTDAVNALLLQLSDEGQSVNSAWIANWVELISFASVPLKNTPLYAIQLVNCLGIDLMK